MQNGWPLGTIEQNGGAGCTMAYGEHDPTMLASFGQRILPSWLSLKRAPTASLSVLTSIVAPRKETDREKIAKGFVLLRKILARDSHNHAAPDLASNNR